MRMFEFHIGLGKGIHLAILHATIFNFGMTTSLIAEKF